MKTSTIVVSGLLLYLLWRAAQQQAQDEAWRDIDAEFGPSTKL